MFDRRDALLVLRAATLAVVGTTIVVWLAATLGLGWRILLAVGGS